MHAGNEEPDLDDAAFAGVGEAARQWVLLKRRVKYDPAQPGHHELWWSVGGSMGQSELLALNIEEGSRKDPGGRRFELEVMSAGEARAEAATAGDAEREERRTTRKEKELTDDRQTLIGLLERLPAPETHTKLRTKSRLSGPRFELALDSMIEDETVRLLADFVTKGNNRSYDAYWLAGRELPQRSATVSNGQESSDRCVASQQSTPSIEGLTDACVQECV
jgi:hypothetical protein